MKNLILSAVCCLICLFIACDDEPKTSSASEIERMKAEIEQKRAEITDKKELDRLAEEAKRLDNELKQLSGGSSAGQSSGTASKPAPAGGSGKSATVTGNSVNMRSQPSISGEKVGTLNSGEAVSILNENNGEDNSGEAVLVNPVDLFTGARGTGTKVASLPKGKAVMIESWDEAGKQYFVSYQHPEKGKLYATIKESDAETISGTKWYLVKKSDGKSGWVLSKFLKLN
jgi:hypothetical protein